MVPDTPAQSEQPRPTVTVVVPTYREAENLPELLARLAAVRETHRLDLDVLIMDDDSRDGTEEAVAAQALPWVTLHVRTRDRGLSAAVLDGYRNARGAVFVVMDADLSHPPEKIPEMLDALGAGADFVLGSRYVRGGATDEGWGVLRWVNSKAATLLARPFTRVKDPMSGFFAIRRETFETAAPLNPVGYKIGLEMLVKGRCRNVREIPIHFSQRRHGESKLSLKEQLRYLQHLRRLAMFKYTEWSHFLHFAAVGFSGVFVNLAVLTLLDRAGVRLALAVALAILSAMISNFWLNRRFTFPHARARHWLPQMLGFILASTFGGVLNWCTVMLLVWAWPALAAVPQLPALAGIVAGLLSNFLASRYLVFRKAV